MDLSELGLDKDLVKAMGRYGLEDELALLTSGATVLEKQLDTIVVTEVSPDRLVKVSVDGRMALRELALDPGIYKKPDADALAASILATIQRAASAAAAKADAACEKFQEGFDD